MTKSRSVEIDLLRVAAILFMMAYHTAYDLHVLHGWSIDVFHGTWWFIGKTSAVLFLLLVGMSFSLSWSVNPTRKRILRRGVRVLGYGCIVSLVTYIYDPVSYVRFGILHLIGASLLLLPFLHASVVTGITLILLGLAMKDMTVMTSLLLTLGVKPPNFISLDYYPLIPWFGVIAIGTSLGRAFLDRGSPTLFSRSSLFTKCVTAISKKSLLIYMIHQPVLLFTLWLLLGEH